MGRAKQLNMPNEGEGPRTFVDGRFEVLRSLGEGAQGVVYAVHDRAQDSEVALKVLTDVEAHLLYRFKREFRELAEVVHPDLATLYEFFGNDGTFCFTMELVEGRDWLKFVRDDDAVQTSDETEDWVEPSVDGVTQRGSVPADGGMSDLLETAMSGLAAPRAGANSNARPLVPSSFAGTPEIPSVRPLFAVDEVRLRDAFRRLVSAVFVMHGAGKMHLDLKPSNVLVRPDGSVCILDFGLAQSTARESGARIVGGTPSYMAPEQGTGDVEPASDWYAVGVMLYQALTGVLPFTGASRDLMTMKRLGSPVDPHRLVDGLPDDLVALALRMIEPEPTRRPTELQLREALDLHDRQSQSLRYPVSTERVECVGRERELELLHEMWKTNDDGALRIALVQGPSGIGKSTVVETFLEDVQSRDECAWVLRGRCYENEFLPYRGLDGVIDHLSRKLAELDPEERELVLPRSRSALVGLFPVLESVMGGASRTGLTGIEDSPGDIQRRAVKVLRELFMRLRQRFGLLVYIDDLQWADSDTIRLMLDLFAPPAPPGMMLLLSARDDDLLERADLSDMLARLSDWGADAVTVQIERLASDALFGLVRSHAPHLDEARQSEIVAEAAGSPFLLLELAREHEENKGRTLDEILLNRVNSLPARARAFVETLSVAGRPMPPDVVFACVEEEVSTDNMTAMVAQLKADRLVRVRYSSRRDYLECYHDRIRQSVAQALPQELQTSRHSRIAKVLVDKKAPPEDIVPHLIASGAEHQVAEHARRAAESAARSFAFARAADFYELVLKYGIFPPRESATYREKWARCLVQAGQTQKAVPLLLSAAEHLPDALELRSEAAGHLLAGGRISEGMSVAETVLKDIGGSLPRSQLAAGTMFAWNELKLRLRRYRLGRKRRGAASRTLARDTDVYLSFARGFNVSSPLHSTAFFAKASNMALQLGDRRRAAMALGGHSAMISALFPNGVGQMLDRCWRYAKECGDAVALKYAAAGEAFTHYFNFGFERAHRIGVESLTYFAAQPARHNFEEERMHLLTALCRVPLGFFGQLEKSLPQVMREMERRGEIFAAAMLNTGSGSFLALVRDDVDALIQGLSNLDKFERSSGDYLSFYEGFARVNLALYTGEVKEALAFIEAHEKPWRKTGITHIEIGNVTVRLMRAQLMMRDFATTSPAEQRRYLRRMEKDARKLVHSRYVFGRAAGKMIESCARLVKGDKPGLLAALAESEALWESAEVLAYADAVRYVRGCALGGERGEQMMRVSLGRLEAEGVRAPEVFLRIFQPFPTDTLREWHAVSSMEEPATGRTDGMTR